MKKTLLILFSLYLTMTAMAQTNSVKITDNTNDPKALYKLYPTQNMWTFLKLDTSNGRIWQVQYSVSGKEYIGETILNLIPFAVGEKAKPGRYTLYPTDNIWTFLMLDQIDGTVYQVQWSQKADSRGVMKIE